MVRITGTCYCGNTFCQPIVQYLDLFNKPMRGPLCSQNGCTAAVGWDAERTTDKWMAPLWSAYHLTQLWPVATTSAWLYPRERRTLWPSELKIVIVRLITSCYWVVVQSHIYVIVFRAWFLRRIFQKLCIIICNTYWYVLITLCLIW